MPIPYQKSHHPHEPPNYQRRTAMFRFPPNERKEKGLFHWIYSGRWATFQGHTWSWKYWLYDAVYSNQQSWHTHDDRKPCQPAKLYNVTTKTREPNSDCNSFKVAFFRPKSCLMAWDKAKILSSGMKIVCVAVLIPRPRKDKQVVGPSVFSLDRGTPSSWHKDSKWFMICWQLWVFCLPANKKSSK